MMSWTIRCFVLVAVFSFGIAPHRSWCLALSLEGVSVVPHVQSTEMRYRHKADFDLGARVRVFLKNVNSATVVLNADTPIQVRGRSAEKWLDSGEWSWHDFPSAWPEHPLSLPPGAMTVWSWNGNHSSWGIDTNAKLTVASGPSDPSPSTLDVAIASPRVWLSSITFLGEPHKPYPDRWIVHIANRSETPVNIESCQLWLPRSNETWRSFLPQDRPTALDMFPEDGVILPGDRGGAIVTTGTLPLTYAVVEVRLTDGYGQPITCWEHLRVKSEAFDISGGWVASTVHGVNTLTFEPFLQTLQRMYINTAHIGEVAGYSDNPELACRYPLKMFHKLDDFKRYNSDEMRPRIHAVEFLGEPQYGGGTPVPPMEVWRALAPYQPTQLPTTVTHSEERVWRFYAGLSDYPHYDAYRVTAPSPDAWGLYERWDGERIRWGSPLETIGVMTRSLRDLNRPAPIAYWSQGAHHDWDSYGGRKRTSPTPAELRAQAYHALAARVTSLYWFNLSLQSILKFPDLIDPITHIGREIRLLEDWYLEGDAYHYERVTRDDKPDWDLSVVAGPRGAMLFALDLRYRPNLSEKVFEFGPPRIATLSFPLPSYLRHPAQALRIEAEAVESISFDIVDGRIEINQPLKDVNLFLVSPIEVREKIENRRKELISFEESIGFDPARRPADLERLQRFLETGE